MEENVEELVEKAKNGDSDAFTNLILNIEKDLYCIAKSKINDENITVYVKLIFS